MAVAEPLNTTPVIYDAFISYSHAKDKPIATALLQSMNAQTNREAEQIIDMRARAKAFSQTTRSIP